VRVNVVRIKQLYLSKSFKKDEWTVPPFCKSDATGLNIIHVSHHGKLEGGQKHFFHWDTVL